MMGTLNLEVSKIAKSRLHEVDFNNIKFGKVYSDHMFVADYFDGKWQKFRIVPYGNLSLSPATSVIHYGQSIFEGMKAHRNDAGEVLLFRPEENYKRMIASAERMCIPPPTEEMFMGGLLELLNLDKAWVPEVGDTSLYIRPYMFATDEYIGIRPSEKYSFIIFTCPVGAYYTAPVRVKIETKYTRAVEGGTGAAKAAGNYAGSLLPMVEAQKQGYNQVIYTDGQQHKYLEEAGTMNIMFVIDGKIVAAPVGITILKGITRESVLILARDWGYQVEERQISVDELIEALENNRVEEAFGTGTAATIAPISAIGYDGKDYELPAVEGREFSNKVLQELEDIKNGRKEDNRGWIVKL